MSNEDLIETDELKLANKLNVIQWANDQEELNILSREVRELLVKIIESGKNLLSLEASIDPMSERQKAYKGHTSTLEFWDQEEDYYSGSWS